MANTEQNSLERSIRNVVDSGGRFSQQEIIDQVKREHPNSDAKVIGQVINRVLVGPIYDTEGAKYGRRGN